MKRAPVLFLSNYYPPEVNALANRTGDHARAWAAEGGDVEVMAGPPHFPEGQVHPGFENRLSYREEHGVHVTRVPMLIAANEGFARRIVSYVSYLVSAVWYADRTTVAPAVVVSSTPQFFAGLAGWLVSARLRRPFVLEVRDLWPESIVDVGAMRRGRAIRALEWLETRLYRAAHHIVVVSPAFRGHIQARGVPPERISVLPNGVDASAYDAPVSADRLEAVRDELGLEGKFVASYIGTVGLAHGVDVILDAAERCDDPDVVFLVAGAGAEWQRLRDRASAPGRGNVRVIGKQPRDRVRLLHELTDVAIVPLRDRPAFRKVIPSKMFESMAARRPVVLGVRGQAAEILEAAAAGLSIRPEDPDELLAAVLRLKGDPELRRTMGAAGASHVAEHFDRAAIARRYWQLLQSVAAHR